MTLLLSLSCSEQTDKFGNYYEGQYNEDMLFYSPLDSVIIIFEQAEMPVKLKENIPYSTFNNAESDSIKLKLYISFGSYSQRPNTTKDIQFVDDTVYIWYSTRNKFYKTLSKDKSIISVATSPRPDYVSVDSIVVYKHVNKFITLFRGYRSNI
ncbi:MAG: hypothetical protein FD143_1995 [Ignavibacteria bacterium]|nr:MAG: hypothetical protein FD143_1995 [Ignavibacteria bacterium]KAF0159151.1 MAG: hypothetical protein FD188_2314 [Ignavibacteria bacterium]